MDVLYFTDFIACDIPWCKRAAERCVTLTKKTAPTAAYVCIDCIKNVSTADVVCVDRVAHVKKVDASTLGGYWASGSAKVAPTCSACKLPPTWAELELVAHAVYYCDCHRPAFTNVPKHKQYE